MILGNLGWMNRVALLGLVLVLLGACSGGYASRQLIYVRTGDAQTNQEIRNASCILSDGESRQWRLDQTPGEVVIERGGGMITVMCRHEGYIDSIVRLNPSLSLVTMGNAAVLTAAGGGFLAGGGLAAGTLSGATLSYPRRLNIAMAPGVSRGTTAAPPTERNLREQAAGIDIDRSCDQQIGPYDTYLGAVGRGVIPCRAAPR